MKPKKGPEAEGEDLESSPGSAGKIVGGLLKKAVTLGAGAYVSAEDTLKQTLNTVQLPKEVFKEVIEKFFESYTVQISAEINFVPKKKNAKKEDV